MIVWIIYFDSFGVSKIVAEKLAECLEADFDVNVANAIKLKPEIISEESPDILIYGTSIKNGTLNEKLLDWSSKFHYISDKSKNHIQQIFSFGIANDNIDIDQIWRKHLSKLYSNNIISNRSLKINIDDDSNGNYLEIEKSLENYSKYIINSILKTIKEVNQMKKKINIVTIISSPHRKGYSATLARKAMNAAEEEGVEVEEIYLLDYDLKYCSGCMSCVSGDKCALNDDLNLLRSKLEQANGLILSSPTYGLTPNAIMMNFMQRVGLYAVYRSSLAGKYTIGISTAGGVGPKKVAKYLTGFTDGLFEKGITTGYLGVKVGNEPLKKESLENATNLGKKLVHDIKTKKKYRFQKLFSKFLSSLVITPIMKKNLKENGEKEMKGVYEYLKEKGKI